MTESFSPFAFPAKKFTPTFRASDLGTLCSEPGEKFELEFVLKYFPFAKHKSSVQLSKTKIVINATEVIVPKIEAISTTHQTMIKKELQLSLEPDNGVKFNDRKIAEKLSDTLSKLERKTQAESVTSEIVVLKEANKKRIDWHNLTECEENELLIGALDKYEIEREFKRFKHATYIKLTAGFISKERGIQLEARIITRINAAENMNFVQEKGQKMKIFDSFMICGIVDGIDKARRTLIEVKTKNRLTQSERNISFREKMQCMTYMSLTGCDKCYLVESGPNGEQRVFVLSYDAGEFEKRVLAKLRHFVYKYRHISECDFKKLLDKYPFF